MQSRRRQSPTSGSPTKRRSRVRRIPVGQGPAYGESEVEATPSAIAQFGGGVVRVFALAILPIVLLALLAVGIGYFRLSHGPLALPFLTKHIERGINATLSGYAVDVGNVVVALAKRGGLEFQLQDLTLKRGDGVTMGSAPAAAVTLSNAALWSGEIAPEQIDLIEPRLALSYRTGRGLSLTIAEIAGADGASLRDGQTPGRDGAVDVGGRTRDAVPRTSPAATGAGLGQSVDLEAMMAEMAGAAGGAGVGRLQRLGLRDAVVRLDINGDASSWLLPEVAVDLVSQNGEGALSGRAELASRDGPVEVVFKRSVRRADGFTLSASLTGMTPRTLAIAMPGVGVFEESRLPMNAGLTFNFGGDATLSHAGVRLNLGAGHIVVPELSTLPFAIKGGQARFNYDARSHILRMQPSTLEWEDSRVTLVGAAQPLASHRPSPAASGPGVANTIGRKDADRVWGFEVRARDGVLRARDLELAPLALRDLSARGDFDWGTGQLSVRDFRLLAGDADVAGTADISVFEPAGSVVTAKAGSMPLATALVLWPRTMGTEARTWAAREIIDGRLTGGRYRLETGRYISGPSVVGVGYRGRASRYRLLLDVDAEDVTLNIRNDMQPLTIPQVAMKIENERLAVRAADGQLPLETGPVIKLSDLKHDIADMWSPSGQQATDFKFSTDLPGLMNVLSSPAFSQSGMAAPALRSPKGKVDGRIKLLTPLVDASGFEPKVSGQVAVKDGRASNVVGTYDVSGARVTVTFDNTAINADGRFLLAGVPAKLNWQHIVGGAADQQPPLRIQADLDEAERRQLNLDASGAIRGTVPVEVTVTRLEKSAPDVHVRADLTNAELVLQNLFWKKPPGRSAFLDADVRQGANGVEIQNLIVAGDNIAVEGSAKLDRKGRLRSFSFASFTLNLVTRFAASGQLLPDNVWSIEVKGPTYDGRPFFRSLFSVGQVEDGAGEAVDQAGIDLSAEIETVIGFNDVSLRGLKMKMSKRNNRLTGLSAYAILDGGQPLAVELYRGRAGGRGPVVRQVRADSTDAGQAFRLIGFYPNVKGGRVRLQVDLEGRGAAEQTGVVWVEDFEILGDPVVAEVVSVAGEDAQRGKRRIVREKIPFELMRAPFSVGHGQFVLNDASLKGPLLGVSLTGSVDYERNLIDLGGTYVPLQGLNNLFGPIPILGQIMSGPRGDGIFGVTFGIKGQLSRPQALVNPLSPLAPGIFREIFAMTPLDPKVRPRAQPSPSGRSSGTRVDGWSSQTAQPE